MRNDTTAKICNDLATIVTDIGVHTASGGGQPCVNDKLSIYRFQQSSWEKEGAMLASVQIL
jgi:hypothetical protein